jgi:hypothetical protein
LFDERCFQVEHAAIQKDERAEGLLVRGGRDALRYEVIEEGADFPSAERAGMLPAVEVNEAANPRRVTLLGRRAKLARSGFCPQPPEERERRRGAIRGRRHRPP